MDLKMIGTSSGGIPIYRRTWKDGSWWEFYGEQPWIVTRLLRQRLAPLDPDTDIQQMAEISRTVRLAHGTTAWSWDLPVHEDSIDSLKSVKVIDLSRVMAELHLAGDMNEVGDDQKKVSSGRWWRRILSLVFGWTSTTTSRKLGSGSLSR
jgi:hypothetical protein|tara:strand:+ start:2049 stop:2498 length:450 start_codon:yes stop_codon:yes gene_type:complete